jgi:hypothetical protein
MPADTAPGDGDGPGVDTGEAPEADTDVVVASELALDLLRQDVICCSISVLIPSERWRCRLQKGTGVEGEAGRMKELSWLLERHAEISSAMATTKAWGGAQRVCS